MLISKTTFLEFQMCPKNTWLKLHKPELLHQFKLSEFELHLVEQGNEVEALARNLWPHGVLVASGGEEGCRETERLMASGVRAIFQATVVADGFIAKCDVLVPGAAGSWDIYEIKGTNSKKEGNEDRDHISDLTFQAIVLERAGVNVGRMFIVHLKKDYVRRGALDVEAMFVKDESGEQVRAKRPEIEAEMAAAREYLNHVEEPNGGCECHYRGRGRQCTTFAYSHPEIPEYAVHDIVRIGLSKKKLAYLVDNHIYSLDDVPDDFEIGDGQANQVRAHKARRPILDPHAIGSALAAYTYPLHFLDYETFAPAIPAFDGFSPYQRVPFQFSLHILREPGDELEHVEFLHEETSDPTARTAHLLSKHIAPHGSVIVWHAPFERGVNCELATRRPEFSALVERINAQLRDLEKIFTEQHYVHPDFRGRTSIKAVLPVLCPELSYDDLAIKDGASASNEWWRMISPAVGTRPWRLGLWGYRSRSQKKQIATALRAYCARDSYAMYAIWKVLQQVVCSERALRRHSVGVKVAAL
jgi:CRISPR/Cas system-associated exonuclease Cas4 (RecB family)